MNHTPLALTHLLPTLGLLLLVGLPAFAQKTVSITCRCVADGTNATQVEWLRSWVIPNFEAMMEAQGNPVTVELIEFGGTDEALKEQYALDLSVGRGADVMGFDGFWVPEFVGAGTLLPLSEVAGAEVDSWEGWAHIPESCRRRVHLLQDGRNGSFENFRDGAMPVESGYFYRSVVAPGADFALDDRDAQLGWAPMSARATHALSAAVFGPVVFGPLNLKCGEGLACKSCVAISPIRRNGVGHGEI